MTFKAAALTSVTVLNKPFSSITGRIATITFSPAVLDDWLGSHIRMQILDKAAVVFVAASRTLSLMSSITRKRSWRASQQDSLTRHWLLVKLTRRSSKISDKYLSSVLAGSVTRAFQIPCMLCWIF